MKKTLQDQYLLIKEGKGHKDVFIKEAKHQFPNFIRNAATYSEVVNVLKGKSVISENIVNLEPINGIESTAKTPYEVAFQNFLKESQEEEEKAELKKPSKQVDDNLSHGFDTSDKTNHDNLIFDQVMKGYYAEMCDPKNEGKTMGELKSIVYKNLEKNPIHYTEDGQFGVKGLGYQTEAPGLGTPEEAKGKYKASGYGDLKESKLRKVVREMVDKELTKLDSNTPDHYISIIASNQMSEDEAYNYLEDQEVDQKLIDSIIASAFPENINESKLRKVIRESVEKELAAINKEAEMEILDTKLEKIEAAMEKRQSQLNRLDEDEDMKALTDKNKVKQIQKDIKTLGKAKAKIEKQLSKKDKPAKSKIIDEDEPIEEAIDDQKIDKVKASLDDIDTTVDNISKKTTEMFENEENLPQDILNQVVEKFADVGGDIDSIPTIAASFPNYEEEIVEFLEGYDLGLDYDI